MPGHPHINTSDDSPLTRQELKEAIKHIKANNAPGEDQSRGYQYKHELSENEEAELDNTAGIFESLCGAIWRHKEIPSSWRRTILISLRKDQRKPLSGANTRGIALLNLSWRIFAKALVDRINPNVLDTQFGFTRAKNAPQAILGVRNMVDKILRKNSPFTNPHIIFIDVEKAFDKVSRAYLPAVLKQYGVGEAITQILQNAMHDQISVRYPDGSYSEPFSTNCGVKQGCPLSPLIFSLYIDLVLRHVGPDLAGLDGLKIFAYADDLVLFAPNKESAQRGLSLLETTLNRVGLRINAKKTNAMSFSKTLYAFEHGESFDGHNLRCLHTGNHKAQIPDWRQTRLTNRTLQHPTVLVPTGTGALGCPFERCQFATKAQNPQQAILTHIRHFHKVDAHLSKQLFAPRMETIDETRHIKSGEAPRPECNPPGPSDIYIRGTEIQNVTHYKYLGSIVSGDNTMTLEFSHRTQDAWAAFHTIKKPFWASPHIPQDFKRQLFRTNVESILMYGAEAWSSKATAHDKIFQTYMSILRHITKTNWRKVTEPDGRITWTLPTEQATLTALNLPPCHSIRIQHRLRLAGQIYRAPTGSTLRELAREAPKQGKGFTEQGWESRVREDLAEIGLDIKEARDIETWKEKTKAQPSTL